MKVTLINGATVELKAISLARRDLTRKVNQALALATKLDSLDEAFGDDFNKIEDEYLGLATEVMEEMKFNTEKVAEADVIHILVYFRTGSWNGGPELGKEKGGQTSPEA